MSRRRERFTLKIIDLAEIHRAFGFPGGFSGLLVQGNHVLDITAIAVKQEEVPVKDNGGAGSFLVVQGEVGSFPKDLTGLRIKACGSIGAEMNVDMSLLDRG